MGNLFCKPKRECRKQDKHQVRVWCDGCYDLTHFGHANNFRQAKALGGNGCRLIVGVHNDEEVAQHKRPPVFSQDERCKMLMAIKWVDEVVKDAPYVTTLATLDQNNCKFCVHGDDITLNADGIDCYKEVKATKRFKEVMRTQGVSTTDLVKRMLWKKLNSGQGETVTDAKSSPYTSSGQFLPTSHMISRFSTTKPPAKGARIVYVDGTFDLFHMGHVDFLEKAKARGDHLIAGVHGDSVVSDKSSSWPIMELYERAFNVMSCKFVDNVVFNAPFKVSTELMEHLSVDIVCHGKINIPSTADDPYRVPKAVRKFEIIDSGSEIRTSEIIERILKNRREYEESNQKKEGKENAMLKAQLI